MKAQQNQTHCSIVSPDGPRWRLTRACAKHLLLCLLYPPRIMLRRRAAERTFRRYPGWFLSQPMLLEQLRKLRNGRERFHVVCGGRSAPHTVDQIRSEDFVMGFGYAGLLDLTFDAYFFEVASERNAWDKLVTRVFVTFYHHVLRPRTTELFFKNYWNGRVDTGCLMREFNPAPRVVMDVHVPAYSPYPPPFIRRWAGQDLMDATSRCLSQAGGSALTLIALAVKAGAREVVVHGLDLEGPHFYATREFEVPGVLIDAGFREIYPIVENDSRPHATRAATVALIPLLQHLAKPTDIRIARRAEEGYF